MKMLQLSSKRLLLERRSCSDALQTVGTTVFSRHVQHRHFSNASSNRVESRYLGEANEDSQHKTFDDAIAQEKNKQASTPWHREGSNLPPVRRPRTASAMVKGKLLTTPSRLLKLIIPLTTADHNVDRKTVQPLALLVHPQQPLSYLERLIQSELPIVTTEDNKQKIPAVHFKAEDFAADEIKASREEDSEGADEEGDDSVHLDGKVEKTGKISPNEKEATDLRGGPGEGGVESYSGAGREAEGSSKDGSGFVRWSTSTEIGDFIRDAARGKEFAVEIEGAENEIRIGVPSFNDRTHYLRTRLRKKSQRIADMAVVKMECDKLAHQSAQNVALCGFGGIVGWWALVYYLTFQTSLGWDVMEPVTYLVGLSTLMGGYGWFLWHNREASYRSALNLTITRRQNQLYQAKGFDVHKWETLVQEANALRAEVKNVANEYDVDWDERGDEHDETVHKALKEDRESKQKKSSKDEGDGKDDEKDEKD